MKRRTKPKKWGEASPNTLPALESAYWTDAPVADLCRPPSAVASRLAALPPEPAVLARTPATYRKSDAPLCRVPGCERRFYRGNRNGVCREHNHALGYCGCTKCEGRVEG